MIRWMDLSMLCFTSLHHIKIIFSKKIFDNFYFCMVERWKTHKIVVPRCIPSFFFRSKVYKNINFGSQELKSILILSLNDCIKPLSLDYLLCFLFVCL